jgi:hypothetical protein
MEGNGHCQIEVMSKHITKGTEEPYEKPVRIASALAMIQMEYLPSGSLQRYV